MAYLREGMPIDAWLSSPLGFASSHTANQVRVCYQPQNRQGARPLHPAHEPRAGTKGNVGQQSTRRTQSRMSVSKALVRIRQIVAVDTRGGSRMRESRTYGSERGARGNSRPYRDARVSVLQCSDVGSVIFVRSTRS